MLLSLLAVAAAGAAAGVSNALAGAGSLITFPTLIAVGVPPLAANVTSTVGLVPGAAGGAIGYVDLVREQSERLRRLTVPTLAGAAIGTVALLLTSNQTFEAIVPILVAGSCLLLLFQPQLTPRIAHAGNEHSPFLTAGLFLSGAYAAYFGSAVGILLLGLLGLFVAESMQHLNAIKIILGGLANLLATVVYAFLAPVHWEYALCLAVASLIGGRLGANLARRVSGDTLRVAIAILGLLVAAVLAVRTYA
ncbi:MAG TPA: sulfite exporter TauE/SafE family protein [Solirubrobacterales bacterium]|nr:sulfite exporter TauE/SafE family protein [Solirubrobacterales bacterium]